MANRSSVLVWWENAYACRSEINKLGIRKASEMLKKKLNILEQKNEDKDLRSDCGKNWIRRSNFLAIAFASFSGLNECLFVDSEQIRLLCRCLASEVPFVAMKTDQSLILNLWFVSSLNFHLSQSSWRSENAHKLILRICPTLIVCSWRFCFSRSCCTNSPCQGALVVAERIEKIKKGWDSTYETKWNDGAEIH